MIIPVKNFSMIILIIALVIGIWFEFTEGAVTDESGKRRTFPQLGAEDEPVKKDWTLNVDPPGKPSDVLGSSITLKCTATDPNVKIHWTRWVPGTVPGVYTPVGLPITDGILRIVNRTKDDAGRYICVGTKEGLSIATYIPIGEEGIVHTDIYDQRSS